MLGRHAQRSPNRSQEAKRKQALARGLTFAPIAPPMNQSAGAGLVSLKKQIAAGHLSERATSRIFDAVLKVVEFRTAEASGRITILKGDLLTSHRTASPYQSLDRKKFARLYSVVAQDHDLRVSRIAGSHVPGGKNRTYVRTVLADPDEPVSIVSRARKLEAAGLGQHAIDLVYDSFDRLFRAEKFTQVNSALKTIGPSDLSTDLLMTLLTVTLRAKADLRFRPQFFDRVEQELRRRGENLAGLLDGLR
jgi:hypothetical protein